MSERIDQIRSDAILVFECYANYIKHIQKEFSSLDERLHELKLQSKHSWREKFERIPQILLYFIDYVCARLEREPLQRILLVTLKQIARGLTRELPRHSDQLRYLYLDISAFISENQPQQRWFSRYKGYFFIAAICATFYWILPVQEQKQELLDLALAFQDSWRAFVDQLEKSKSIGLTMIEFAFAALLWSMVSIALYLLFRSDVELQKRVILRFGQEFPVAWNLSSIYEFRRHKRIQSRFAESEPTCLELAQARLWKNLELKPEIQREYNTEFWAGLLPQIAILIVVAVFEVLAVLLLRVAQPQAIGSILFSILLGIFCIGLLVWDLKKAWKIRREWQILLEGESLKIETELSHHVDLDERQALTSDDHKVKEAKLEIADGLPVVHTQVDTDLVAAIRSMREE
ncbi:MAG: hypothetical protein KME03_16125 [Aphanocapsa lilacina HA4352-LM1]|nr:hypothetical protein [Aphanocapsa lilacina HA4352-LM1]